MNREEIIKLLKMLGIMAVFILAFTAVLAIVFTICFNVNKDEGNSYSVGDSTIKYIKGEGLVIKGDDTVKLYNTSTGQVENIKLEDYVKAVVAAEMPAEFSDEAIKAQAVAARTYYFSKRLEPCVNAKGAEICDSTHCQVYMSKEKRMKSWGASAQTNWDKISQDVDATSGQVLLYNDELVMHPQFFSTSSGKTENSIDVMASDVPYLKSVDSPGEEVARKYESNVDISINSLVEKLNSAYANAKLTVKDVANQISILSRTEGGSVKEVKIGNETITGVKFRAALGLNSANFSLSFNGDKVRIDCKGYGHGVGMSQWGANVMAKEGKSYEEILKHYYTGVDIDKVKYDN